MAEARQLTFFSALDITVTPRVSVRRESGGRAAVEQGGAGFDLEGSPKAAARVLGLPARTVYRMIEEGDIPSRCPRADAGHADEVDSLGRRKSYRRVVDMRAVYRIRYGAQADEVMAEMGLN